MMKDKMTRRIFLKTIGATAAVVSAAGLFSGCDEVPAESNADASNNESTSISDTPSSAKILWTIKDNGGGTATLTGYDKTGPEPSGYVVIPSEISGRKITTINANFSGCTKWVRATIPGTVKDVRSFGYCANMKMLTFQNGVENIYPQTFLMNRELVKVSLPQTLKWIGYSAFSECTKLKEVEFPNSLETISDGAFNETALEEIVLPPNTYVGDGAFARISALKKVTIGANDTFYGRYSGPFGSCTSLQTVAFSGSVEELSNLMFYKCNSLTDITLPYGLKKIGESAFTECDSVKSISLPITVTKIGNGAFARCKALTSVSGMTASQELGTVIFRECDSLRKFAIPDGTQTIPKMMFYDCENLKAIYIPVTVKKVEEDAFGYCPNLKTVYYGGNQSDWASMYIQGNGSPLFNATIYGNCSASDLK